MPRPADRLVALPCHPLRLAFAHRATAAAEGPLFLCRYQVPSCNVFIEPSPPPPSPPPPQTKPKIVLRGVHFDLNQAKIRPGDAAVLDEAAEILKSHPSVVVNVNGYCDAIGSEAYNLKLSQRRAEAVAHYLEQHGVPRADLIAHGYGKTNFVAPNDTAEGRAQNRRVELLPVE